jgi:hypothetical protein
MFMVWMNRVFAYLEIVIKLLCVNMENSSKINDRYPEDEDKDCPWNVWFFSRLTNWHSW